MLKQFIALLLGIFVISVNTVLSQSFTEVAIAVGVDHTHITPSLMGGGVVIADFNNDDHQDLFLTGGAVSDAFFLNDGSGNFNDFTVSSGIGALQNKWTNGAAAGDVNNDGYVDLFIATNKSFNCILLLNNGDSTFTDISVSAGFTHDFWSISCLMTDYNLDGYLDIYVGNYVESSGITYDTAGNINGFSHDCYANYFYINNGDSTFTESAASLMIDDTGCALAVTSVDMDMDYDLDIYIANDFGEFIVPNVAYQNSFPLDAFSDISASSGLDVGLYGMGIAKGDYDQDGDFDFYVTNLGRNSFLRNDENNFTDIADVLGVENTYADTLLTTGWGTMFADFNNDSYLDLYVCNGYIPAAPFIATSKDDSNKLYMNDGLGGFTDESLISGTSDPEQGRGSAYGDIDNDGDLDIIVTNIHNNISGGGKRVLIYRNDHVVQDYIQVKLESLHSNRNGIGSIIKLYSGSKILIQEIDGGSSHCSQNSMVAHFGLGSGMPVDSIEVIWPGGNKQKEYNATINTINTISEVYLTNICALPISISSRKTIPNTVVLEWNCAFSNYSSYVIRGKNINSTDWIYVPIGISRSRKFSNLPYNQTFEWQIKRACDSMGLWWSELDTFNTSCEAPDSLFVTSITHKSAQLNWNPVPAYAYKIVGRPLGVSWTVTINLPASTQSYNVNSLTPGNSYEWAVQGICHPSGTPIEGSGIVDTFTTSAPAVAAKTTDASDLSIWPNPSRGHINIDVGFDNIEKVQLYNIIGQLVYEEKSKTQQSRMKLKVPNGLPNGLYQTIAIKENGNTNSTLLKLIR